MIVDFLRSCYESDFRIDEATNTIVRGRYYFSPPSAQLYESPTVFRSAIWLDDWQVDEGEGDLLQNVEYNNGGRDFSVIDQRIDTLKVSDCRKPLHVVAGVGGFPVGCGAIPYGQWGVSFPNPAAYIHTATGAIASQGASILTYVTSPSGELVQTAIVDITGDENLLTMTIIGSKVLISFRMISTIPGIECPLEMTVRIKPYMDYDGPYTFPTPEGWEVAFLYVPLFVRVTHYI